MAGILLATHGGPSAEGAARMATLLATKLGTILHALGVVEPLAVVDGGYGVAYVPTAEEEAAVREAFRAAIADQMQRYGISVVPEVVVGSPAFEVASVAQRDGMEVIVVGLGPHHLLDRTLGHETALHLAQHALSPVLAVPETASSLPRRAVAAVDFTPTSLASARTCAGWLSRGDVLHLVHVAAPRRAGPPSATHTESEQALRALVDDIGVPSGVQIEFSVVEGEPAKQLLHIAANTNADLIALGSHGYGAWKRLTVGSVASKIIRVSPMAVLVTPIGSLRAGSSGPGVPITRVDNTVLNA